MSAVFMEFVEYKRKFANSLSSFFRLDMGENDENSPLVAAKLKHLRIIRVSHSRFYHHFDHKAGL
jgi:hypothetical protein